jgi:4'-phosphopantetheinyl transferase EntD
LARWRLSSLVARLLTPGLSGAEIMDRGQAIALHPDEAHHIALSGDSRRRDFALGRHCARAALAQLGHDQAVIGRDISGAPLWPPGVTGSITHTRGYAAALAARTDRIRAIGLDAEHVGGVTEDLFARLFTPAERAALAYSQTSALTATILFSAKEAFFKTGLAGPHLMFQQIGIVLEGDGFRANGYRGRFTVENDLVLTALAIPA